MSRSWIKLYVDNTLRGSCFLELKPDERFVWFGFLLLAGDCDYDGKICVTEDTGYSDEQLAKILKCDIELIKRSKEKMLGFDKISFNGSNVIEITNWKKYQSEYMRQRDYREEYLKRKFKRKLQRKVTTQTLTESYNAKLRKEEDKEEDIDKDKDIKIKNKKNINIPVNEIVKLFNEICKDLTKVSTITDKRKKTIGYRWNKYAIKKDKEGNIIGIRLFEELFNMANESDWLSGRVKKWTATFDWLMIEENMIKVLEGNYDNRTGNGI